MADALVDAIQSLKPSAEVRSDVEQAILRMAAFTMVGHANDIRRTMDRINADLEVARSKRLSDDGQVAIEDTLWRISAIRERLLLLTSLAFGVPTVEPFRVPGKSLKTGVTLKVMWSKLEPRLSQLAKEHRAADGLGQTLIELYEHRTRTLRNEISHGRAPIRDASPIVWLQLSQVKAGKVIGTQQRYLWPQDMSDRKDIQAETLWDYVVQAIEDAVRLLNRAVDLLADLIRRAAALEPGQAVYQNHDSGEITIDLARST